MKAGGIKLIAKNRKALFDYEVVDSVEAGLVLQGTEVKSLRDGKFQFKDAFAASQKGELWLHRAYIDEYSNGNIYNHEPTRSRKLLLHRHQIDRLAAKAQEKGLTLIPLEIYFKDGRAKVKLGLCRGKAKHDKRASIKERDEQRAARRALED